MFYLKRRGGGGDAKFSESSGKDEFGWWLGEDQDTSKSSTGTSPQSSSSSSSPMVSCIDSDEDGENFELTEDYKGEEISPGPPGCTIEFTAIGNEDLDVELIEKDAVKEEDIAPVFESREQRPAVVKGKSRSQRSQGLCYTPERLVRSQEYRILTPSPRYLSASQARITPENENPQKARRCRRRLSYLIDSKQIGATQLKALLDPNVGHILSASKPAYVWRSCPQSTPEEDDEDPKSQSDSAIKEACNSPDSQQPTGLLTPDSISKKSSSERLNSTWEDEKQTRCSSLEQTSGIHSNDWSSDTHSDSQNPPICLCDELASANYSLDFSKERVSAINEVVSILGVLETEPDKAAVLLDEDRFCDSASSHDQLTRLALTIEPDANVPAVLEDPESLVHQLQRKVERLEVSNKDIFRDICTLRKGLQYDEERIAEITSGATKLRQDIHEMRYLDDLLNLLQGELERISRRRWPFVLGHSEHHFEEMNLIV